MSSHFKMERGYTLIEVLASIVIVGIILTIFFGIYGQSMLFSNKNENQLIAMNLAREVLANKQQNIAVGTEYTRKNNVYFVSVKELPSQLSEPDSTNKPPFGLVMLEVSVYSSASKTENDLLAKTFGYVSGG